MCGHVVLVMYHTCFNVCVRSVFAGVRALFRHAPPVRAICPHTVKSGEINVCASHSISVTSECVVDILWSTHKNVLCCSTCGILVYTRSHQNAIMQTAFTVSLGLPKYTHWHTHTHKHTCRVWMNILQTHTYTLWLSALFHKSRHVHVLDSPKRKPPPRAQELVRVQNSVAQMWPPARPVALCDYCARPTTDSRLMRFASDARPILGRRPCRVLRFHLAITFGRGDERVPTKAQRCGKCTVWASLEKPLHAIFIINCDARTFARMNCVRTQQPIRLR